MDHLNLQLIFAASIFLSAVFMNVVRKNTILAFIYLCQSTIIVLMLGFEALQQSSWELFGIAFSMFFVKVIIAPNIFTKFIKTKQLNLTASTYLNLPITLIVIVLLTFFAQSDVFTSISIVNSDIAPFRVLLLGSIFSSFFLVINRRGVLSQIIGILSLENCIFALGKFLAVKQTASLELGMLFDVCFWIVILFIFAQLIHTHFRSMDTVEINHLKK
ncbi:hypothetical protein HGA88_05080 [Candidatus Roizmanbacteria bacterium]|nr:hypothetical protein [Candidatus Roizmanbacteria bacterium]